MLTRYTINCLCRTAAQTITLRPEDEGGHQQINLCHCTNCRHNTGLLCTSYIEIQNPVSLKGLVKYDSSAQAVQGRLQRYFCGKCGCHVFRSHVTPHNGEGIVDKEKALWAVSTGVVSSESHEGKGDMSEDSDMEHMVFARHTNTAGTRDGGLSPCIPEIDGLTLEYHDHWGSSPPPAEKRSTTSNAEPTGDDNGVLTAHCHCKTVHFHITRPNASSHLPRSNFPDLMVACKEPIASEQEKTSALIKNPHDEKWWLRPAPPLPQPQLAREGSATSPDGYTRYLAGTCACRSCRLASGFEIQTWAFVPRANIYFHVPAAAAAAASRSAPGQHATLSSEETGAEAREREGEGEGGRVEVVPLDFSSLGADGVVLKSYESSPGVLREFCPRCGATVFWHDRWRPDVIDVSVGLLDAPEGARAETWLDWWAARVSFIEDVESGRGGDPARRARALLEALEKGLGAIGDGLVTQH